MSATAIAEPGSSAERLSASGLLRIGAVSYLNAEPSVRGLAREPGFRIERDVPARVAERLHAGEVDLALIPSIEYALGHYAIVPGIAIASRGPVRSVCLFHRAPLERVRRVAVDSSSRTSAAWCACCCATRLGRDPEYVPMAPTSADAGQPRRGAAHRRPGAVRRERRRRASTWARSGRELTGLPFVFAFWAGRPEA